MVLILGYGLISGMVLKHSSVHFPVQTSTGGKSQESDDTQVANWAWTLAQKLCLHVRMQPRLVLGTPCGETLNDDSIPDMENEPQLQPIMTAVTKDFAIAAYLALVMSKYGHRCVHVYSRTCLETPLHRP